MHPGHPTVPSPGPFLGPHLLRGHPGQALLGRRGRGFRLGVGDTGGLNTSFSGGSLGHCGLQCQAVSPRAWKMWSDFHPSQGPGTQGRCLWMNGGLPLTTEAAVLAGWAGSRWGATSPPFGTFQTHILPSTGDSWTLRWDAGCPRLRKCGDVKDTGRPRSKFCSLPL